MIRIGFRLVGILWLFTGLITCTIAFTFRQAFPYACQLGLWASALVMLAAGVLALFSRSTRGIQSAIFLVWIAGIPFMAGSVFFIESLGDDMPLALASMAAVFVVTTIFLLLTSRFVRHFADCWESGRVEFPGRAEVRSNNGTLSRPPR
jgi:hypothetical protein